MTKYKNLYVDKTIWIKEVIESKQRIQVYSRPLKMGKSVNITMLKRFINIREHNTDLFYKLKIT